jgi:hypothetical protein
MKLCRVQVLVQERRQLKSQDGELARVCGQGHDVAGYPLLVSLPEMPLKEVPEVLVLLEVEVLWDGKLLTEELLAEELWDAWLEALGAGL